MKATSRAIECVLPSIIPGGKPGANDLAVVGDGEANAVKNERPRTPPQNGASAFDCETRQGRHHMSWLEAGGGRRASKKDISRQRIVEDSHEKVKTYTMIYPDKIILSAFLSLGGFTEDAAAFCKENGIGTAERIEHF